jgi:hypothetical protein
VALIALSQLGELAGEVRKEVPPRGGPEPERRPRREAGTDPLCRSEQRIELAAAVGDAWKDRHDEDPGANACVGELADRAQTSRRHRRARLKPAGEPGI